MKVKKYSVWISILRLLAGAHDRRVEQKRRAFVVAGKLCFRSSRFFWESMTSDGFSLENDSQQVLAVRLPLGVLDRFFWLNEDPRNICRVELAYKLVTDAVD